MIRHVVLLWKIPKYHQMSPNIFMLCENVKKHGEFWWPFMINHDFVQPICRGSHEHSCLCPIMSTAPEKLMFLNRRIADLWHCRLRMWLLHRYRLQPILLAYRLMVHLLPYGEKLYRCWPYHISRKNKGSYFVQATVGIAFSTATTTFLIYKVRGLQFIRYDVH